MGPTCRKSRCDTLAITKKRSILKWRKQTGTGSTREFDHHWTLQKNAGELLYRSFGRGKTDVSKRYPSAGALYPVIPLLYILSKDSVEGIDSPGCYLFESLEPSLLCLKKWDNKDLSFVTPPSTLGKESFHLSDRICD